MALTAGRSDITVGLVDGPIAMNHPDLTRDTIREVPGKMSGTCTKTNSTACLHGTFVAGILCAKRGSAAPAVCPDCTLLAYPIFAETASGNTEMPSATSEDLAVAILACIEAGARILNLSLALTQSSSKGERALGEALDHAARRGVLIVAAAGNQGTIGGTVITGHPWVIPVAACDLRGKPVDGTNLGHSIGRRGLLAPGEQITSLGAEGELLTLGGTSAAAAFVTGAIALIWSQFPAASGAELRLALRHAHGGKRTTVTPPLLNAWAAYQALTATHSRR
jgi:subtilisin family serine protease